MGCSCCSRGDKERSWLGTWACFDSAAAAEHVEEKAPMYASAPGLSITVHSLGTSEKVSWSSLGSVEIMLSVLVFFVVLLQMLILRMYNLVPDVMFAIRQHTA